MYADVNIEDERLVDDFFDSKKDKGILVDVNKEEDYIVIKDLKTKELVIIEVGTGISNTFNEDDLAEEVYLCYDKETKKIINP